MKKILFLFLISFAFLSCSNNNQTSDISFSFSRSILSENQDTTNESDLNISCKIEGSSINQVKSYQIKSSQKEASFTFEELPVDTTVTVEVNVLDLYEIRLYTGKTTVTIKQGDNPLSIDLKKVEDSATFSIDGINGIKFEFNDYGTEIPSDFSISDLNNKNLTAKVEIITDSSDNIKTENLHYYFYLNGEQLTNFNGEEITNQNNTITISPKSSGLKINSNKLLVIVRYDNPSTPIYYSASLDFNVAETEQGL